MIIHGDALAEIRKLADNSIDSVVTDPPYGINFMGKKWDYAIPSVELWGECLRALKPGAHALVACGTRTQHRMACSLEDAGFEIRDVVAWLYGSGFPKSHNISKTVNKVSPSTAQQWQGWGTALKPAMELWSLVRKPLSEPTVAANVMHWGAGALNIEACRVPAANASALGRWPANVTHDGSDEVVELFPSPHGAGTARTASEGTHSGGNRKIYGGTGASAMRFGDSGSAARFFYCAKASATERNTGLAFSEENNHPTVKPVKLMIWLCDLITPPGGFVLDPFAGSGTTGVACKRSGFQFLGIERELEYVRIAEARIGMARHTPTPEKENDCG